MVVVTGASTLQTVWDAANGAVVTLLPYLIYAVPWWAGITTLILIVLAAITVSLSFSARRGHASNPEGATANESEASSSARPALFWSIGIAVTAGLLLPVAAALPQWAIRWLLAIALVALVSMSVGLVVCLAGVIRDIRTNDRVAGPYVVAAYLTVTAGSVLLLSTGYFLAWIIAAANYNPPF
jgi:hypothetical protein